MKPCFLKFLKSNKGFSLVELIVVMIILAMLGGAVLSLVSSGGASYRKASDNLDAQQEARIAMSYINVKLRQNDRLGAVELVQREINESNVDVLKIEKPTGEYWWIYFYNGVLYERVGATFTGYVREAEIASVSGIALNDYEDNGSKGIEMRVDYFDGTEAKNLKQLIILRSGN